MDWEIFERIKKFLTMDPSLQTLEEIESLRKELQEKLFPIGIQVIDFLKQINDEEELEHYFDFLEARHEQYQILREAFQRLKKRIGEQRFNEMLETSRKRISLEGIDAFKKWAKEKFPEIKDDIELGLIEHKLLWKPDIFQDTENGGLKPETDDKSLQKRVGALVEIGTLTKIPGANPETKFDKIEKVFKKVDYAYKDMQMPFNLRREIPTIVCNFCTRLKELYNSHDSPIRNKFIRPYLEPTKKPFVAYSDEFGRLIRRNLAVYSD